MKNLYSNKQQHISLNVKFSVFFFFFLKLKTWRQFPFHSKTDIKTWIHSNIFSTAVVAVYCKATHQVVLGACMTYQNRKKSKWRTSWWTTSHSSSDLEITGHQTDRLSMRQGGRGGQRDERTRFVSSKKRKWWNNFQLGCYEDKPDHFI